MHVATAGGSAAALCAPPRVSAPARPAASATQMSSNCCAHRLERKRLSYVRSRLRELQKVYPDLTEEVLQKHTLHQVVWSLRRAGKRGIQRSFP
eukprot:650674-Karenia_brevis.AAC.1